MQALALVELVSKLKRRQLSQPLGSFVAIENSENDAKDIEVPPNFIIYLDDNRVKLFRRGILEHGFCSRDGIELIYYVKNHL